MADKRTSLPMLLRDVPLFVEVAKHKSFTLAAEKLDIYISSLSRRIAQLEKSLGLTLFLRSTRHVELTESGRVLYERCRFLLFEMENLRDEVVHNMTQAAGPIRIAVPADVFHTYMRGTLGDFAKKWPEIHLSVRFMHRWVDLLTEPFDLDIRVGPLPDSDLLARKLLSLEPSMYASRAFLERHPMPQKPRDLANMPCIVMPVQGAAWTMWKGKKSETVIINPVHTVNSISLSLELVLAGLGVAWLSPAVLNLPAPEIEDLVPVLPGWTIPGIELNLVTSNRQMPYRVRLFVDHLVEHFAALSGSR